MADQDGSYELSIPEHSDNLLRDIYLLQQEGKLCDVKLQTCDGYTMAHKVFLIAASPYFKNRLVQSIQEEKMTTLYFDESDHRTMESMISCLYSGATQIHKDNLESFIRLSDLLMLPKLSGMVRNILDSLHNESNLESPLKTECNTDSCDNNSIQEIGQNLVKPFIKRKRRKDNVCKEFEEQDAGMVIENEKVQLKIPKLSISVSAKGKMKVVNESNVEQYRKKAENNVSQRTSLRNSNRSTTRINRTSRRSNKNGLVDFKDVKNGERTVVKGKSNHRKISNVNKSLKGKTLSIETENIDTDMVITDHAETDNGIDDSYYSEESIDDSNDTNCDDETIKGESIEPVKCPVKGVEKVKLKTPFSKECNVCHEVLSSCKQYTDHMKSHKTSPEKDAPSIRRGGWPCSVCSRVLTSAVRQACHQHSKHGIPYDPQFKLHHCTYEGCNYITASKHYLQIHTAGRHSKERPHVCEFCGKSFKLPSALLTHLNIHTNAKKYQCEECDLTFNQKGGLDIHIKKHHKGQESWTELCHLCSEKFLQKADLCWHMYQVHQVPVPDRYNVFSCELCDYQTIRKNKLERHMDAHDDKRTFVCNICGKKFVTKSYLNRHVKYHGEKSFKCDFEGCNYACVDNLGLRKHVRLMHTHKNFKPFVCSMCQYKTGLRGNLDKHIRTVHNLEVVTKHTVHLRMKFKDRNSGDIITKDGKLVQKVMDTRRSTSEENRGVEEEASHLVIGEDLKPDAGETSDKKSDQTLTVLQASDTHTQARTAGEGVDIASNTSNQFQLRDNPANFMLTPFSYSLTSQLQIPSSVPGDSRIPHPTQTSSQSDLYLTVDPLAFKYSDYY